MKEKWMNIWKSFEEKHPKLSKWVYQIFYFFVFSMGVTVFQYLVFTFMPGWLGLELAGTEFMWPQKEMHILGVDFTWSLLGYNVLRDARGAVIIGGGLSIGEAADAHAIASYVLDTRSFAVTGGQFGIEASVISLAGYCIVAVIAYAQLRADNAKRS